MKKVVKWTAYILILAGAIAAVICYLVVPAETKRAINKLMEYANTPICIAGVTTTVGGILVFVVTRYVMGNTKFGRKELDSMHDALSEFENQSSKSIDDYKNRFDELKSKYEAEFAALKSETDSKVSVVYDEFEDLQKTLLESLKAFPNKHIQELVAEYEARFSERKEEIIEKTINTNEYVDAKIAEINAQYEAMFAELRDKVEKTLNEEAKDNQTAEE